MIKTKLNWKPQIINLIDFYLPVRGNMRRKSSMAENKDLKEDVESIEKEITEINKNYENDENYKLWLVKNEISISLNNLGWMKSYEKIKRDKNKV